jgi:hypothetical protein
VRRGGKVVRSGKTRALASRTVRLARGLTLKLKHGSGGRGTVTVAGSVLRRGAAPGLIVTVQVTRNGRKLATASVDRHGAASVKTGRFSVPVALKRLPRGARMTATVTLLDEGATLAATRVTRTAAVR